VYEGTSALALNPPKTRTYDFPAPPVPGEREPSLPTAKGLTGQPQRAVPSGHLQRRAAAVPAMRLSFRAVFLFLGAMIVLMFIVYSRMELSQLSKANQAAATELQALKREESNLSRRFEAGVSLSEVEAYAVGELGMVKPSREQIVTICIPTQDRAEVVRQEGFWGSVRNLFANMGTRVVEVFD
jgi:cell division protein FtsL